jgi:hypothetical protein
MKNRVRWAAAIAAGLLLIGGVAIAAIPSADGTIHGCRKNSTGDLRVIDAEASQTCNGNETSLTWSQTGPQGPAGPAGPAGPPGSGGPLLEHSRVLREGDQLPDLEIIPLGACPEIDSGHVMDILFVGFSQNAGMPDNNVGLGVTKEYDPTTGQWTAEGRLAWNGEQTVQQDEVVHWWAQCGGNTPKP